MRAIKRLKERKLASVERTEMDWHLEELQRGSGRMNDLDVIVVERYRGNVIVDLIRTIPGRAHFRTLLLVCCIGGTERFPQGESLAHL